MADKSFGVKELNLLGSSGTPSIESPNDLNLNANTVAISTNLTVGSKLSVTSAGIVTAVSGVVTYYGDGQYLSGIGSAASGSIPGINTEGTSTFENIVVDGNAGIGSLNVTGVSTFVGRVGIGTSPGAKLHISGPAEIRLNNAADAGNFARILCFEEGGDNAANLAFHVGSGEVFRIDNDGNVGIGTSVPTDSVTSLNTAKLSVGILSAYTYYGDGANLTGIVTSGGLPGIDTTGTSTFENIIIDGNAGIGSLNVTGVSTFGGYVYFDGDVVRLGNSSSDRITGSGRFQRDVTPSSSWDYNLGQADRQWQTLFSKQLKISGISTLGITSATDLEAQQLNVTGVSTFTDDINANGNIIGDGSTVISGISSLNVSSHLAHTGDTHTKLAFGTGVISLVSNGNTLLSVAELIGGTQVNDNLLVSGNAKVTGVTTFNGDVSIGGTLTYEDVTNVDSIGIITAREGIRIGAGKSIGSDGAAVVYYGDGSKLTGVSTVGMTRRWNYINDSGDRNLFTADAGGTYEGGSDSCYNIAAGYQAMNLMTNSTSNTGCNIALGRYAGCCSDGAEFNISIGDQSGQANTSGKHNINMGYRSGACNDTTCYNIYIGCCAGMHGTGGGEGGNCNIAIGIEAAKFRCGGSSHRNIALGYQSGHQGKGTDNISLGYRALYGGVFCGSHNIGIGSDTGKTIVNADNNIFMGRSAGYNTCHGSDNIMLGRCAGYQQICGNENVFIGQNAGYNVRNGCCNTMIGYRAGVWNCNGCNNVYIGDNSGGSQSRVAYDQGTWNVSIGSSAGRCMCTSYSNALLGAFAGSTLSEGDANVLLGAEAGDNLTTGSCNVFIGFNVQAPYATSDKQFGIGCATTYWIQGDGSYNTTLAGIATVYSATGIVSATKFCGDGSCLTGITTAGMQGKWTPDDQENLYAGTGAGEDSDADTCCNVAIGYSAGHSNVAGDKNVFIGACAGSNVPQGGCNVFLGGYAGEGSTGQTTGPVENIAIGLAAGRCLGDSGTHNVMIGEFAGYSMVSGTRNILMGDCAGACCNITGASNIAIGAQAARCVTSGSDNIAIGCCSMGGDSITGSYNISFGRIAGRKITSGSNNVFLGKYTGCSVDIGTYNVFLGADAGRGFTAGSQNVAIGREAGKSQSTGNANVYLGSSAAYAATGGANNIIAGHSAGNTNGGNYNIMFGRSAGCENTSGSNNVFLGHEAAKGVTTGSCNVVIGYGATVSYATGKHQLAIGIGNSSWITGNSDFNVGIGTTNPNAAVTSGNTAKLSVGILSAYTYYGDGSNLTGVGGETLISGITVQEESSNVGTAGSITILDFQGANVTATASGSNKAVITVAGADSLWVSNDTGIHTTSNVGIGTTTNLSALLTLSAPPSSNNDLIVMSAAGAASTERITIGSTTLDNGTVSFEGSEGTLFSITNNLSSGSIFSVNDISGIPSIDVDADGTIQLAPLASATGAKVGIGTTNPSSALHVVGDVKVTGVVTATDFDSTSDIRLKTNIKPIDDPLAKVVQIEGVSFNWKKDNRPALGVIADQIEKVIPELVHGDDPKTVNYNGLVGLLIEVVKDQQTQIDDLNKRLSKLE